MAGGRPRIQHLRDLHNSSSASPKEANRGAEDATRELVGLIRLRRHGWKSLWVMCWDQNIHQSPQSTKQQPIRHGYAGGHQAKPEPLPPIASLAAELLRHTVTVLSALGKRRAI
jgi:hypothetical protein